jgi:hypothetical protein
MWIKGGRGFLSCGISIISRLIATLNHASRLVIENRTRAKFTLKKQTRVHVYYDYTLI